MFPNRDSTNPSSERVGRPDTAASKLQANLPSALESLPYEAQRHAVIDQLLAYNSQLSGQPINMPDWAYDEWNLRVLPSLAREPDSPATKVGTFFGFEYKNEDHSLNHAFYNQLESTTVTPATLFESLALYPALEEALGIAKRLLQFSTTDRALGISLLTELCRSDSHAASPTIINWTGGLLRWLLENIPDESRHTVTDALPGLFRVASPSFLEMLRQSIHESLRDREPSHIIEHGPEDQGKQTARPQRITYDLIDGLARAGTARSYSILLGAGISEDLPEDLRNRCLDAVLKNPLDSIPALNRFISRIRDEKEPEKRSAQASLLGAIDDVASTYWGSLVPWVYEQPLRICEHLGQDVCKVWRETCPSISPSAFIFAYNLARGDAHALASFEQIYSTARRCEGDQWFRVELKKSLISCSFLNPVTQKVFFSDYLPMLPLMEADGCLGAITLLGLLPTKQRREFPQLAVQRLKYFASSEHSRDAVVEPWLASVYEHGSDRSNAQRFIEIAPESSLDEEIGIVVSEGLFDWLHDDRWYSEILGSPLDRPLSPFPPTMLASNVVSQYIRAQTIEENELTGPLLREMAATLSLCDPTARLRWESYRHDENNPIVARQLRALSPLGRTRWRKDLMAFMESDPADRTQGQLGHCANIFLAVLTDWPEFMLKIGKFPIMTAACTAFDSGAYYSKGLVSYLSDAHIKAALLFDMDRLVSFVAPQLPEESANNLRRGEINQDDLYRYAGIFLQACVSRTIVKLVEDEFNRPFLFIQPSFVRGSLYKEQPNITTVKFLAAVAERVNAGLASAVFMPDPQSSSTPLFLPGRHRARALTIPPSRSPGGQIENWDNAQWVASHRGSAQVIGLELFPPQTGD